MRACHFCCTDAISCEAKKRRCVGSYPGRRVEKRSTGGHAWGCTQERRHSLRAGTGCQGAPAPVGVRLLSRGLAAASSPRCERLSGQECSHGHTSHCHATTLDIGWSGHRLEGRSKYGIICKSGTAVTAMGLATQKRWHGAYSGHSRPSQAPKTHVQDVKSYLAPAEHAQRGLQASAGGVCLQVGGLHGFLFLSCTASGLSMRRLDGCAGCVALHAPALLCCVLAQQLLAPVYVQEL